MEASAAAREARREETKAAVEVVAGETQEETARENWEAEERGVEAEAETATAETVVAMVGASGAAKDKATAEHAGRTGSRCTGGPAP